MVISVEPGIYLPGANGDGGGYRHSDTVLVTREGFESFTSQPTDLSALTITGWKPYARTRGRMIRNALSLDQKARFMSEPVQQFRNSNE
jgi:Xaa-Pro dipeptidase